MPTLHIQHAITDFQTWVSAFERFSDHRRLAGVRAEHVRRPVDDERYVVIDLDFGTVDEAEAFRRFLIAEVWAAPASSPGLAGRPEARILETVSLP